MWTQLCPGLYYYFCWICFQRFGFLLKFNFQVQAGRKLAPTTLGITLIRGYQCIDPDLGLPDIRSFIEQQITLVAKGQADHSGVVQHVLQQFRQKYSYFVKQVRESYHLISNLYVRILSVSSYLGRLKFTMNCIFLLVFQ